VKISPDVGQSLIKKILDGLDIEAFICDLGIWTDGTFDEHLAIVDKVLERLHKNGTKCNPLKCEWFVQETDFLGYWMAPKGAKPMKKKIDTVLKMGRPGNQIKVRASVNLIHIPGKNNVLADTFSRLPRMDKPTVGKKEAAGLGKEMDFRAI